jgi:tRNA G46 methylase TrmB
MSIHDTVRQQLQAQLAQAQADPVTQLNNSLRLLSKWRSVLIQNTVLQQQGTRVWQGPLQGLDFLPQSAEGCHIAKLLGCYEQPLLPYIEQAIQEAYPTILNIGCAEGYYAVGMARRMPDTKVLAFDLNPKAQETCQALAEKNGARSVPCSNPQTLLPMPTRKYWCCVTSKAQKKICSIPPSRPHWPAWT